MLVNLKKTFALPPGQADFGSLVARIKSSTFHAPTRLYAASGKLISDQGIVGVDANGNIDVWVTWGVLLQIELVNSKNGFAYSSELLVDPQSDVGGLTTTQENKFNALYNSGINGGLFMSNGVSFDVNVDPDGMTVTIGNLKLDPPFSGFLISPINWGDGNSGFASDLRVNTATTQYQQSGTYTISVTPMNAINGKTGNPATEQVTVVVPGN